MLARGGDQFDNTYPLPASDWTYIGKPGENRGYRYLDRSAAAGPIKVVIVKNERLMKALGQGAGLNVSLAHNPAPVHVILGLGMASYHMEFGGVTTFKADSRYTAASASAPASCPAP